MSGMATFRRRRFEFIVHGRSHKRALVGSGRLRTLLRVLLLVMGMLMGMGMGMRSLGMSMSMGMAMNMRLRERVLSMLSLRIRSAIMAQLTQSVHIGGAHRLLRYLRLLAVMPLHGRGLSALNLWRARKLKRLGSGRSVAIRRHLLGMRVNIGRIRRGSV